MIGYTTNLKVSMRKSNSIFKFGFLGLFLTLLQILPLNNFLKQLRKRLQSYGVYVSQKFNNFIRKVILKEP